MHASNQIPEDDHSQPAPGANALAKKIAIGLGLGVLCGLFFGEYCRALDVVGNAYVGLLQMTVLPYVVATLISQLGRLDLARAPRLATTMLLTLLLLIGIGVLLVSLASMALPPVRGSSSLGMIESESSETQPSILEIFIPENVFRSLSHQMVPAIVLFCVFFGIALTRLPRRQVVLGFLDVCADGIMEINRYLIRAAPFGVFAMTAAAAGTLYLDEISKLQAYLLLLLFMSLAATILLMPILVSSITPIGYRQMLRAAAEPALTAIATGKLFVVLPQIVAQCERLLASQRSETDEDKLSPPEVIIPLAYALPHMGKVLTFVFVAFAAWLMGTTLSPTETIAMTATGAVMSFSSPLVTIPLLLDQYEIPQDVMPLFLIPGFLTMRLGDVVGVFHLMTLSVITSVALHGGLRIRARRLLLTSAMLVPVLMIAVVGFRHLLKATIIPDSAEERFLSLEIPSPHDDTVVLSSAPPQPPDSDSALQRIVDRRVLRVGFHADHLPYSFFNNRGHLVGMDVELMHQLATRLQVRLEFVPWTFETVIEQLDRGEFDVVVGGLMVTPERLTQVGFSEPYQTATLAIALKDDQRHNVTRWDSLSSTLRLGIVGKELSTAAARQLPEAKIVSIPSVGRFFRDPHPDVDGLIIAAEEAAAWTMLHPEYTVVIPRPEVRRPVAMAIRLGDEEWARFLDRWIEFERSDGTLDQLRQFWIQGGGTKQRPPRWSILRNVLNWAPGADD